MSAKKATKNTQDNAAHGGCSGVTCSASSLPRWRFHKIRNTNGWIGIVDTHHEDAGHIAGWVRPEDSELALAALNHFQPNTQDH
jgi:hypothetical protein